MKTQVLMQLFPNSATAASRMAQAGRDSSVPDEPPGESQGVDPGSFTSGGPPGDELGGDRGSLEARASVEPDSEPIRLVHKRELGPEASPSGGPGGPPSVEFQIEIGPHGETNFYTGFAGDLSDGGLFIATYEPLPVGAVLTVALELPDGRSVSARATVRWVRDPLDRECLHPGMGVELESLPGDSITAIEEFMRLREPIFYAE